MTSVRNDGIDYSALAERLRRVHGARSEQAQKTNAEKKQNGGTGLDDVLNALDSGALDDVVTQVQKQAQHDIQEAHKKAAQDQDHPFRMRDDDAYMPSDKFRASIAKFFAGQFLDEVPRDLVARAIVTALAQTSDHGGILDDATVGKQLGQTGLQLLLQVKTQKEAPASSAASSSTARPKLKFTELDPLTAQKVARSRERQTFIERMPLLSEITKQLGGPGALKGFTMASVQHLFPSTRGLYDALVQNGLPASTTSVGGKNYSSNADAVFRFDADGFHVHHLAKPQPQEAGLDAEKLVYEMAEAQLGALFRDVDPKKETKPRFLLLDDGGKLIRALHEQFPQYAHLCVAVEQTDRGIQHIEMMEKEGHKLLCPVVNMARSVAKKEHEGPMIGESVVFHAEHELAKTSPALAEQMEKKTPKTATIIGYGAVGVATAQALKRRGYDVAIVDIDEAKLAQARKDGFATPPKEQALLHGDFVYGCTGRTVLTPKEFQGLKDGAILVNGASGNHEFGLHEISAKAFGQADPKAIVDENGIKKSTFRGHDIVVGDTAEGDAIQNRVLRLKSGKELLAVRSGYVVNMTLGLPPEYVQLTLGLLLAGCLQAVKEAGPGIKEIPDSVQDFLVGRTEKHLDKLGHDLHAPDFRSLTSWAA